MDVVKDRYPLYNLIHEIAIQASLNDDEDTIMKLVHIYTNCGELPYIRWDALIPISSSNIVFMIIPLLTEEGMTEAAYKLRDVGLIKKYGPNETYAIKYRYYPDIPMKIDSLILGYIANDIWQVLNDVNYILFIQRSLELNRPDIANEVISLYKGIQSSDSELIDPYLDMDLPKNSVLFLVEHRYLNPSPIQLAILNDQCRDLPMIPSQEGIKWIIHYDALDCYKSWSLNESNIQYLTHDIHGKILHHILTTSSDVDLIKVLVEKASEKDIDDGLKREDPLLTSIFMTKAIQNGWYELVEKYSYLMSSSELISLGLRKSTIPSLCIKDITSDELMRTSIIHGNIPMIQSIIKKYGLSDDMKILGSYLSLKYHGTNPSILIPLKEIFG